MAALDFPGRGAVQRVGDPVELLRDAARVQPRFAALVRAAVADVPGVAVEVPATLKSLGRIIEKAALDAYAGAGAGGSGSGGRGAESSSEGNDAAVLWSPPPSPKQSSLSIAAAINALCLEQGQVHQDDPQQEAAAVAEEEEEGAEKQEEQVQDGEQADESPALTLNVSAPDSRDINSSSSSSSSVNNSSRLSSKSSSASTSRASRRSSKSSSSTTTTTTTSTSSSNVCRVFDVVRAMVVCNNLRAAAVVVRRLGAHPDVCLVRAKERFFEAPSDGGWRDCMMCFYLRGSSCNNSNSSNSNSNGSSTGPHNNDSRHICEVQVVHRSLLTARKGARATTHELIDA